MDMTLENSLNNIANAIELLANRGCCDNSGSGGSADTGEPETGNTDNGQDSPDTNEWPTYGSYLTDKCNRSAYITGLINGDLLNLENANWVAILSLPLWQGLLLLIPTILSPIPGDEILVFLGIIAGVAGGAAPLIASARAAFADAQQAILCAFFNAPNASQARTDALAAWETELVNQGLTGLALEAAKQLAGAFLTFDNVNNLFDPGYTYDAPDADCSACGNPCVDIAALFKVNGGGGQITGVNGTVYTLTSTDEGTVDSNHRVGVVINWLLDQTARCGSNKLVEIVSVSGSGFLQNVGFQVIDDGVTVYGSDQPWVGTLCGDVANFVATDPFVIELDIGADCP